MTAINVCVVPDAVHLFTDAGHIEVGKNEVGAIANKVALAPEYGAAIAANGQAFVEKVLTATLAQNRFDGFDALAAGFTEVIKQAIAYGTNYGAPSRWRDTEIVLAGWSKAQDSPMALLFESTNGFAGREITRFIRPALPDLEFHPGDIARSGLEMMRAQRQATFPVKDNSSGGFIQSTMARHVVHGFCQQTIIRKASVETRMLERWPDEIRSVKGSVASRQQGGLREINQCYRGDDREGV